MKYYLITLIGGGDKDIKLVGPKTWAWILHSPKKVNIDEEIPEDVLAEMEKLSGEKIEKTIFITSGSWENDRALQSYGISFNSIKDVNKWLKENNAEIEEEYDGCIY